ncbi:MAG: GNAT family N-acetyltransferase [Actinobacteria bacterium]|nr:MAG: GNAT family N-acetyltransferase [Actinomycetota bacterium]
MSATHGYPAEWESDVVLTDGGTAHVRPIRPTDADALVALHARLSQETIYLRFFTPHPVLSTLEIERFTQVDYDDRMALIAELDDEMVAVARYDRNPGGDGTEAEVAFTVDDVHQGRGLGTILLEHLAVIARAHGITRFVAETLPQNRRMRDLFHAAGFQDATSFTEGVVRVVFPIEPTEASEAAMHDREQSASARSVERLLRPRSIAVIGAGRRRGTIGHEILRNLLDGDFAGPVYPVHPTAPHVASVRAYPSVIDVPDDVDVAVIVVPASQVLEVVEQCATKRVRGLVVISAGFAETGPDGAEAERELVRRARAHGMRMVGPNCMGVVNTAAGVSMNATFAPVPPRAGRVAFSSQSGALGIAVLEQSSRLGLGVSTFVSVGNKADVSTNDLLQYWERDDGTDVVLLYVESFGNPRSFSRIARRVSRRKPIVAVKSGRSAAGTLAATSHTAALASPEAAVDALFRQTGVIRVDTLEQLFDVAHVLTHQPLPRGGRVAIVGNAGGPGILAADACEGQGLEVPELSQDTRGELRSFLPAAAAVRNPVDLVASASAADYGRAVRTVLADSGVDAVVVIFIPPLVTRADDVARAVSEAAAGSDKPVLANFLAMQGTPEPLSLGPRPIPSFAYPEAAANALARVVDHAAWLRRPEGALPDLEGVDGRAARILVDTVLDERPDGTWLDPASAIELLSDYGIPIVATTHVTSADEAVKVAEKMGFPVVLKAGSGDIVHKIDVGGVRLGLGTAPEVAAAYTSMEASLGEAMGGAVVQTMADAGPEVIVGVVQDPSFGPLVMFGSGGTAVELLGDRVFRVLPLTDIDAYELVRATRGSPLLFGYRGAPPLRVGRLVDDIPEIAELDLNPVIASPAGAVAVDAKVRLAPWMPRPELALRRLR